MSTQLVRELQRAGLEIGVRNSHLALSPRSRISSDIRQKVKAERDLLLLEVKNAPSRLVTMAIAAGVYEQGFHFTQAEIRRLQSHDDLYDAVNCSTETLQAWASALAIRATQARGKKPAGWDKTAICRHCGPVWSFHGLNTLSCGWCEMRKAGKPFPQSTK